MDDTEVGPPRRRRRIAEGPEYQRRRYPAGYIATNDENTIARAIDPVPAASASVPRRRGRPRRLPQLPAVEADVAVERAPALPASPTHHRSRSSSPADGAVERAPALPTSPTHHRSRSSSPADDAEDFVLEFSDSPVSHRSRSPSPADVAVERAPAFPASPTRDRSGRHETAPLPRRSAWERRPRPPPFSPSSSNQPTAPNVTRRRNRPLPIIVDPIIEAENPALEHNAINCPLCTLNPRGALFMPCGHTVCRECAPKVNRVPEGLSHVISDCFFCRTPVSQIVQMFLQN